MSFSKKGSFEYPFGKRWVYASLAMSAIAIIFAVFMLGEEGPLALLLYFAFTSLFTAAVLVLKFYLYFLRDHRSPETYSVEGEAQISRRRLKWSFIILVGLAILALFVPLILLMFLSPLWWLICITSYVPAVNIPEIILYVYSARKNQLG
jgi:phosphoglycerol transferase MdoB-like AlkP superfamily enzyme